MGHGSTNEMLMAFMDVLEAEDAARRAWADNSEQSDFGAIEASSETEFARVAEEEAKKREVAESLLAHADKQQELHDRVSAFRDAAIRIRCCNELEKQAIAGFVRAVEALPTLERVKAFWDAVEDAACGSALREHSVAGMVKHADALPEIDRVKALQYAAKNARSGSTLEQEAVLAMVQHVDELPDASARIATLFEADKYAAQWRTTQGPGRKSYSVPREILELRQLGDKLRQQIVASMGKHASEAPDASTRIKAFRYVACYAESGSVLDQQAVAGIIEHADGLSDVSARIEAFKYAVEKSFMNRADRSQHAAAVAGFVRAVEALPKASDRIKIFRETAQHGSLSRLALEGVRRNRWWMRALNVLRGWLSLRK